MSLAGGRIIVELRGVSKAYATPHGQRTVLDGINLTGRSGELLVVTGPSGSGKTTLLNLAGMMDEPSEGQVVFDGVAAGSARGRAWARGARIGFVFQRFHLLPGRSVLANILFRLRYTRQAVPDSLSQAEAMLDRFGLTALRNVPARNLSAGEMQRVALARALLVPPDLLVADEPTGNLDSGSAALVMDALSNERSRGACVLLATHNAAHLSHATRRLECVDGRILYR